ncbi:LPS assembly protein LptD [Marinobacteraceae bacterium S3BR75-40.1]
MTSKARVAFQHVRFFSRLPVVALVAASGLMPAAGLAAGPATVDAASLDWTPRYQLSEEQRAEVPAYCPGTYVQPPLPASTEQTFTRNEEVRARGRQARYDQGRHLHMEGDVELQQGPLRIESETADYYPQSGQASLGGPIVTRGDGFVMTGSSADYDAQNGELRLNTASFLFHAGHIRGQADRLSRPTAEREVMVINQGVFTTCEPDNNAWSIAASRIRLDRAEGFGTAEHVRLRVKDVPVFYLPWISFPIDDRRKSGFLYPSIGTSNTGRGMYLAAPYYFNLAPEYDATYVPQYIHGRGLFNELEGRYLSPWGETVLAVGYLNEDDQYLRENPGENGERWGLNFESAASWGSGWRGNVDYGVVSDKDYLSDLNRTLEINSATHLERTGGITYSSSDVLFEGMLQGFQTLDDNIAPASRPYNQLPALQLTTEHDSGLWTFSSQNQYVYFWRDNEELTGNNRVIGSRLRLQPQATLGLESLWGFFNQTVTLDHTQYLLSSYDRNKDQFSRTVPFYELDTGLYFDRSLDLFGTDYNQSLEPRLYYVYSPAKDQSFIPNFDTTVTSFAFSELFSRDRFSGGDRVGDNNRLTAAVTTRFHDLASGMERARFSVGQIYHYDDREVQLSGTKPETRSTSSIAGEAVLRPIDTLDLKVSGLWDPREWQTEKGRSEMIFHSPGYDYLLSIGHTYDNNNLEQGEVGVVFPIGDKVSVIGRYVKDMVDKRTIGTLAGLEYTTCCWSAQLVSQGYFTDDEQLENRILFQIELRGLGSGGGAGEDIADVIPGFEKREESRYRDISTDSRY